MIYEKITLCTKNNINNKESSVDVYCYIPDILELSASKKRKTVIVCPGGGYMRTTDREAEPIALKLLSLGYNAFVLKYTCDRSDIMMPLAELANTVALVRENHEKWNVDTDKIIVGGFSAGGHLAMNFASLWHGDFMRELTGYDSEAIKPNGLFLSYPAITYTNQQDFLPNSKWDTQYGTNYRDITSQISNNVPEAFLWHTFDDSVCPVTDSLNIASKYYEVNIPCELHVFPKGVHGLALANHLTANADSENQISKTIEVWFSLLEKWLEQI